MRTVRELVSDDTYAFRELRLEGLRLHPEAFGSSYEVESNQPLSEFGGWIAKGAMFGGFVDGRPSGMAGLLAHEAVNLRHKGVLFGMYVRESERGSGLAEEILAMIVDVARERVEQLQLSVATTNHRAIRFYRRLGFEAYATEPKALKLGSRYIDELLMVRFLSA